MYSFSRTNEDDVELVSRCCVTLGRLSAKRTNKSVWTVYHWTYLRSITLKQMKTTNRYSFNDQSPSSYLRFVSSRFDLDRQNDQRHRIMNNSRGEARTFTINVHTVEVLGPWSKMITIFFREISKLLLYERYHLEWLLFLIDEQTINACNSDCLLFFSFAHPA